jgi:hypothetical protein
MDDKEEVESAIVQYVCAHEGPEAPSEEELHALLRSAPSSFFARWAHHVPPRLQIYFERIDDPRIAILLREQKRRQEHELKPSTIRNRSAFLGSAALCDISQALRVHEARA